MGLNYWSLKRPALGFGGAGRFSDQCEESEATSGWCEHEPQRWKEKTMCARTRKTSHSTGPFYKGQHRFEHWYRDNQVYFITARCWDKFPAFKSEEANAVFWDRFTFYTQEAQFTPWVTSIVVNHYHSLGYCKVGETFGTMMQRIHGSVAKLVNDLLPTCRRCFGAIRAIKITSTAASATRSNVAGRIGTR